MNKILIVSLLALMVLSCEKKDETIKVGAILALTGSGANYGKSLQQGIELAKDEINKSGGIKGKKMEVIYEDSQGDPKTGVSAFNKLVSMNNVPVVLGSISSVVLAIAPIADEKQVVFVNSSAISPKIKERADKFLFSLITSGADEAKLMASELVKKHGSEPIGILFSNNASGIDTKDSFIKELATDGGTIAFAEGYELGTNDFRSSLTKIKNSKAKYCYLIAFSSQEFAKIFIQSKEIGLRIQWYSYSGIETKETLELSKGAADGVIYSYPSYLSNDSAMIKLQEKFSQSYGSWPDIYTVTSYDGVKLLSTVLNNYGTTSLEIQKGLRETKVYNGIFGKLDFSDKQCVSRDLIWKTIRFDKYEVVK